MFLPAEPRVGEVQLVAAAAAAAAVDPGWEKPPRRLVFWS